MVDAIAGFRVHELWYLLFPGLRDVVIPVPVGYAETPSASPVLGGASLLILRLSPASRKLVTRVRVCSVLRRGGKLVHWNRLWCISRCW
jgi:hypothetical protein